MKRRLLHLVAGTAAMLVAATAVGAAPAEAKTKHPRSTAGLTAHLPARVFGAANPTTNYGAGYFMYPGTGGTASASVTFVAPAITCASSSDNEWLLPGIWVYSGGALSQQVDVNLNCNSGVQLREGIICINGGTCDTSLQVAPGDKVICSIAYTPGGVLGTVRDITQGTVAQVSGPANTTDDVVFIGADGPSLFGVANFVPTFSKVTFTSVQFNGQRLVNAPSVTGYNLKTATALQVVATPIKADGQSFVDVFRHN